MALLELRASGSLPDEAMRARISEIAAADRHARGRWPGPRPLPDRSVPLFEDGPESTAAALGICATDRAVTLEDRVGVFMRYLSLGTLPESYKARAAESADRLKRSLDAGATRVTSVAGGRIAVVISLEPAARRLGYRLAPVVVALNPAWRFPSGEIGRKYTVARWHEDDGELTAFGERIAALEPGWGGQHGIKGSPQGRPSRLSVEQIVRLLEGSLCSARAA